MGRQQNQQSRSRSPPLRCNFDGMGQGELEEAAAEYRQQGYILPRWRFFSDSELDAVESLLNGLVAERPKCLAAEDLLNLHMTHAGILQLCRHPRVVRFAQALLQTPDVSIFSSRILCKEGGTGKEIPWHQDSNYWPLVPPNSDEIRPEVASIWMPLDNVDAENGAMQVLPFTAQLETKNRNCTEFIQDSGGSTAGFNNFNLSLDAAKLNVAGAKWCYLKRGESEWHSAWTVHRSDPNKSNRRRLVWIVRYCPTGTTMRGGIREVFDADFPIVPACGNGSQAGPVRHGEDMYAPCFGNLKTMALLKK